MKAKVSVCLIVKNEPNLEDCLKSFREYVDEIVIVDTGSDIDHSCIEVAERYADKYEVFLDCNEDGKIVDFSLARQRSFDLATNDWVMWVDGDDIIEGCEKLYNIIENCKKDLPVLFMFPYEYSYDGEGRVTCKHYRERLFYKKENFNWINPVHEVCCPKVGVNVMYETRDDIVFKHRRQFSNKVFENGRNLRILQKYHDKMGETDARQLYYLGLEYGNVSDWANMIKFLERYLELSDWDDEKYMTCLRLGQYYLDIGEYKKVIDIGLRAITYQEKWGEAYFLIAKAYYFIAIKKDNVRDYERCINFGEQGLSLPETKTVLFINPLERNFEIYKYLNTAYGKVNNLTKAAEMAARGLLGNPNDENLKYNLNLYHHYILKDKFIIALNDLLNNNFINRINYDKIINNLQDISIESKVEFDFNSKNIDNLENKVLDVWKSYNNKYLAKSFIQNAPIEVRGNDKIRRALEISNSKGLKIVIYVGPGLENWDPEVINKNGAGGSEIMAMLIAKELVELGHIVTIYGNPGIEGIFDGVEYLSYVKYYDLKCDVLIVSRQMEAIDKCEAKLKLAWAHDIILNNATNKLLLQADRILALSKWHKDYLINHHNISSDHVIVTRNGIDLNRFNKDIKKNKFKVINTSSPDRGWDILFNCWKKIRLEIPEAELHLYYGLNYLEKLAAYDENKKIQLEFYKKKLLDLSEYGVIFHGRLSPEELAEEFLSAKVWAHLSNFTETYCISATEAQAAGCYLVTNHVAALGETVNNRGIIVNGDVNNLEVQENFANEIIKILKSEDNFNLKNMNYAKENFDIKKLGKEWNDMIYSLLEYKKVHPIVNYCSIPEYK